jgi:hypothetical protein
MFQMTGSRGGVNLDLESSVSFSLDGQSSLESLARPGTAFSQASMVGSSLDGRAAMLKLSPEQRKIAKQVGELQLGFVKIRAIAQRGTHRKQARPARAEPTSTKQASFAKRKAAMTGSQAHTQLVQMQAIQAKAKARRWESKQKQRIHQQRRLLFLGEMVENMDCWIVPREQQYL